MRIVQALPNDVKLEESCIIYDPSEQHMGGLQAEYPSPHSSGCKESLKDEHALVEAFRSFSDLKAEDASWNPFLTNFPNENGSREADYSNDKDLSSSSDGDNRVVDECAILKDICVDEVVGYLKDKVFVERPALEVDHGSNVVDDSKTAVDGELPEFYDALQESESNSKSVPISCDADETEVVVPDQSESEVQKPEDERGKCNNPISDETTTMLQETSSVSEIQDSEMDSVVNRDAGESSFSSKARLITHVADPGNLSTRSDGSAASSRSFAFPILQSEWNCSPVRMAKADGRRHFRKQKGWKSGIFCCRF